MCLFFVQETRVCGFWFWSLGEILGALVVVWFFGESFGFRRIVFGFGSLGSFLVLRRVFWFFGEVGPPSLAIPLLDPE